MSDVKKFTGFIAIDGSTHTSQTAAVEHSRVVKVKAALKEKFGGLEVAEPITTGDPSGPAVTMDDFIFANREAILTCLNQNVLTRKKRSPNKAKAAANDATAAPAVAAA